MWTSKQKPLNYQPKDYQEYQIKQKIDDSRNRMMQQTQIAEYESQLIQLSQYRLKEAQYIQQRQEISRAKAELAKIKQQKEFFQQKSARIQKELIDYRNSKDQSDKEYELQKKTEEESLVVQKDLQLSKLTQLHIQQNKQSLKQIKELKEQLVSMQLKQQDSNTKIAQLKNIEARFSKELSEIKIISKDTQARLKTSEQKIQKARQSSQRQWKGLKQKLQRSIEEKWKEKLQYQKEYTIKNIQYLANTQKSSLCDQIQLEKQRNQQLQAQMQSIKELLAKANADIQALSEENVVLKQEKQDKMKSQILQINRQKEQQLQRSLQISSVYSHVEELISHKVKELQNYHNDNLKKIFEEKKQQIDKNKEFYEQRIAKLKKQAEEYKRQTIRIRSESESALNEIKITYQHKLDQFETLLHKTADLIFNKEFKDIDIDTILQKIYSKIYRQRFERSQLESKLNELQDQNTVLLSCLKEVKQWLRNMNSLINSPLVDEALSKKKCLQIADTNLMNAIESFTSKLQERLKKNRIAQDQLKNQNKQFQINLKQLQNIKQQHEKTITSLTKKCQSLQNQMDKTTRQNDRLKSQNHRNLKNHQEKTDKLSIDLQNLRKQLAQKQADNHVLISQQQLLSNVTIPTYTNTINQEKNRADQLQNQISMLEERLNNILEEKRVAEESLKNRQNESEQRLRKLDETKRQFLRKENEWKNNNQIQLNKLRQIINDIFDSPNVDNNFQSLLQYLKNNKPGGPSAPLTVSPIFDAAPKQRAILEGHIISFLQCRSFTSALLYKYDDFNKNFANYLPIKEAFNFVILLKSKKGQIFGVVACGIGPKTKVAAFNLNTGKLFLGDSNLSASYYDSGYLNFGTGQIRLRNGLPLEMTVSTRVFNTRYFKFTKEQLVGSESGDQILLEAMEIHKINH